MLAADVSDYISDHTGWFIAALAVAILLLLLVVLVTQRGDDARRDAGGRRAARRRPPRSRARKSATACGASRGKPATECAKSAAMRSNGVSTCAR